MNIQVTITRPKFHPEAVRPALLAALGLSGQLVEAEIRKRTPEGVGGASSGLRASIFSEVHESPLESVTGSNLPYAAPVEFGTRPHFPPVQALVPWVEKFIQLKQGETAEGIAFLIARAIARRGTPPRKMFQLGAEAAIPRVVSIFQEKVGQAAAQLIE